MRNRLLDRYNRIPSTWIDNFFAFVLPVLTISLYLLLIR
jgi:hypothetical protein